MKESFIRTAFHRSVLKQIHLEQNTFVIDELGLKNGESRADIVVLNGKLIGYEIKTDKDNLNRLPSQICSYNEVFDQAYIISGEKHLKNVVDKVPCWWGIYLIVKKNEEYEFRIIRKPKNNQEKNPFGIVRLLWKDELIDILKCKYHYQFNSNITKEELYNLLVYECNINKLRSIVLKYLKKRVGWRVNRKLPL